MPIAPVQAQSLGASVTPPPDQALITNRSITAVGQSQKELGMPSQSTPSSNTEPTLQQLEVRLDGRFTTRNNLRIREQPGFTSTALPSAPFDLTANSIVTPESQAIAQNAADSASRPGKSPTDKKTPKSAAPLLSEFLAVPEAAPVRSPLAVMQDRPAETAKPAPMNDSAANELPRDPELGVIQIGQISRDDELGVIQLRSPLQDPELGILELRQIAPPRPRSPIAYFSSFIAASSSDNIFLVEDPVQGRFGDNFIRPGISILAFPALGPDTGLLLSARTTLLRYEEQADSSYDELRFQVGVRQRLSRNAYARLSLSHQLLYEAGFTEQFFTNTGIEWTLGRRDRLTPQLTLDSYYQGQLFFSDPERFSNILNSVGASLNYQINPQWDTGLGYRLTISDFTQQSRHETYQRLTGQLRYAITPAVRMSLFGGLSYGRSSESRITFDDTFFGLSINATVPIF